MDSFGSVPQPEGFYRVEILQKDWIPSDSDAIPPDFLVPYCYLDSLDSSDASPDQFLSDTDSDFQNVEDTDMRIHTYRDPYPYHIRKRLLI